MDKMVEVVLTFYCWSKHDYDDCIFATSAAASALLSGVTARDLALMLAVCEILGNVDWCVDKALYSKKGSFLLNKVVL